MLWIDNRTVIESTLCYLQATRISSDSSRPVDTLDNKSVQNNKIKFDGPTSSSPSTPVGGKGLEEEEDDELTIRHHKVQ